MHTFLSTLNVVAQFWNLFVIVVFVRINRMLWFGLHTETINNEYNMSQVVRGKIENIESWKPPHSFGYLASFRKFRLRDTTKEWRRERTKILHEHFITLMVVGLGPDAVAGVGEVSMDKDKLLVELTDTPGVKWTVKELKKNFGEDSNLYKVFSVMESKLAMTNRVLQEATGFKVVVNRVKHGFE